MWHCSNLLGSYVLWLTLIHVGLPMWTPPACARHLCPAARGTLASNTRAPPIAGLILWDLAGGSGLAGRPSFKNCDRRVLASSGLHGGSPAKCGRCSAAEIASGCELFMRKGVLSHHFRALKKVERSRTAHFRKCLRCRWARFMLLVAVWCTEACWALLEVGLLCKSSAGCCSTGTCIS